MSRSAMWLLLTSLALPALFCPATAFSASSLSINEFMASNSRFVADPQGEYDDWIELHNGSDQPVNVGGLYLTDDADDLTKWQIPSNLASLTTIPKRGYQVIWADNDVGASGLHAGFKLSAGGGGLYLVARDGVTILDGVEYGDQSPDISYGRYPDGDGDWRFLGVATPGAANIETYLGFVAEPEFSREHGFTEEAFDLAIACDTPGAVIYYTTDGREPYLQGGRFPTGTIYAGPIRVGSTLCVRAKAIKPGWKPSGVVTSTYIFLDQVVRQSNAPGGFPSTWGSTAADYAMDSRIVNAPRSTLKQDLVSLPTMSLVMATDDLFNSSTGIYANWSNEGVTWERAGSIELIYPDGSEGFQSNCGVRIYGGVGRREKKKSFRLLFKGRYGATKLRYPLFGEGAVDEFDTIILRANFNDGYPFGKQASQYIRDEYCRRLQLALGHPSAHGTFVHLYVNGLYWGLYNPTERPDASFAASYFGGEPEDYDAYNSASPAGDSTSQSWNGLLSAARAGVETNAGYQRLQGNNPDGTPNPAYTDYLDVESYIDFMIANFFVGNTDWPGHNWYGAMNRVAPAGFHFFMWDAEWVLWITVGHGLDSDLTENRTGVSTSMCEPYARLRNNPEFNMLFADHVHRAFFNGGPLYVDPTRPYRDPAYPERNRPAAMYAELADWVEQAMIAESARWGDVGGGSPYAIDQWRTERNRILSTYMVQRSGIVLDQLRNAGLYPRTNAPVFHVNGNDQHGGHVATGDRLLMTGTGDTIWYTLDGSDPRVPATAAAPSSNETVLVPENASKRVMVPIRPVGDAWRSGEPFNDTQWILSEGGPGGIGYERGSGYQAYITTDLGPQMYNKQATCYIRIAFTAPHTTYSKLFLKMRYDDGFIAYLNGVEVARRNFTGDPQWNSVGDRDNPDTAAVLQTTIDISDYVGLLEPGPNLLAIHGLNGTIDSSDLLISVELTAAQGATGGGSPAGVAASAVRYAGPIVLSKSTVVKGRAVSGGTWSALNEAVFAVGPVAESLRISEIMFHPAASDPNTEYIELTNIGIQTINLNLVRFTDGIEYTFPSFELPAGGYCLLVQDIAAFEAKYGTKLPVVGRYAGNLSNGGERIELVDAVGAVIHAFEYDDKWFDLADGLGFSLTVKDPETADADSLGSKQFWRPSAVAGGSPGEDDRGLVPELGSVVINELMANPSGNASDWIELHNTTDQMISLGGWFLSDDANDLTKYRIASGTNIAGGSYVVFYDDRHFGNRNDPGCKTPFGLNRDGETVYLHSGTMGLLTGYSEQEKFGASEVGVSLGRWHKSTGAYNFVALRSPTPGRANSEPAVGPVVIHEIFYHPPDTEEAEFVELVNISPTPVTLYDAAMQAPWRFTDDPEDAGIELLLPTDPPTTLPAGGYLVVAKDPVLLRGKYSIPATVPVLAWGPGRLANGMETVQLSKPGDVDGRGNRSWIRVDRVVYSDGSHPQEFPAGVDPWPVEADGLGRSLGRIIPTAYGNDPANWEAKSPSPGRAN